MTELRGSVQPGWEVFGSDDAQIGSVHVVGRDYLEVEKGLFFIKDLYIPSSAIARLDEAERRVVLNVSKDAVGDMGWTEPPFASGGTMADRAAGERGASPPDGGYYGTWDERELDRSGRPRRDTPREAADAGPAAAGDLRPTGGVWSDQGYPGADRRLVGSSAERAEGLSGDETARVPVGGETDAASHGSGGEPNGRGAVVDPNAPDEDLPPLT